MLHKMLISRLQIHCSKYADVILFVCYSPDYGIHVDSLSARLTSPPVAIHSIDNDLAITPQTFRQPMRYKPPFQNLRLA